MSLHKENQSSQNTQAEHGQLAEDIDLAGRISDKQILVWAAADEDETQVGAEHQGKCPLLYSQCHVNSGPVHFLWISQNVQHKVVDAAEIGRLIAETRLGKGGGATLWWK